MLKVQMLELFSWCDCWASPASWLLLLQVIHPCRQQQGWHGNQQEVEGKGVVVIWWVRQNLTSWRSCISSEWGQLHQHQFTTTITSFSTLLQLHSLLPSSSSCTHRIHPLHPHLHHILTNINNSFPLRVDRYPLTWAVFSEYIFSTYNQGLKHFVQ